LKRESTGIFTFDEALGKAKKFCANQEHCTSEVMLKLHEWCDDKSSREEIIRQLMKENFLNDFRFVELFVRSKVNQNRWGRFKIEFELQKRLIPAEMTNEALENIDENQYLENIRYLKLRKEKEITGSDEFKNQMKIKAYLASKGYEYEYINRIFNKNNFK
jgi:regulatory protein